MVEEHAGERAVHAIVHVVALLAVAHGLADDFNDQGRRGGHHEAAGLGDDFDLGTELPIELGIERTGQLGEWSHVLIVRRWKAAADVEDLHLFVAALPRLFENPVGDGQRLHVVLKIRALAPHVEGQALDRKPGGKGGFDQVDRLAWRGAELGRELDHGSGVGYVHAQNEAGVRRVLLDLTDFSEIVVRDERLVRIQLGQGAVVFDGICVDDLVPNEVLALLGGPVGDVGVNDIELGHRRDVEAGARLEQGAHDFRIWVRLHRVVRLHARQVLLERRVVAPDLAVIDHEERRAVLVG